MYVQASYPHAARTALYEQLSEAGPGDVDNVWLCNSGTEANEAALKFARHATGREDCCDDTGLSRSDDGRARDHVEAEVQAGFEPLAGGVEFVEYGDADAMREAIDDETAAVILEPLQGEGGINPAATEYLQAVREATEEAGAAMVLDEIQTGLGRTGSLWATEKHDIVPDVLTTAKGLASGLPIGATLCRDWVAEDAGNHGSTFSAGPSSPAAAGATLDVIEHEDLPAHADEMGAYIRGQIDERLGDGVRDVRGDGLMIGIEVKRGSNRLLRDLRSTTRCSRCRRAAPCCACSRR